MPLVIQPKRTPAPKIRVGARTGVFNSTVYRDKVMKDSTRPAALPRWYLGFAYIYIHDNHYLIHYELHDFHANLHSLLLRGELTKTFHVAATIITVLPDTLSHCWGHLLLSQVRSWWQQCYSGNPEVRTSVPLFREWLSSLGFYTGCSCVLRCSVLSWHSELVGLERALSPKGYRANYENPHHDDL